MECINCVLETATATKEEAEKIFQNNYKECDDQYDHEEYTETQCRKIFTAEDIVGFTCYCNTYALHFGEICVDVIKAIKNGTTFEYIERSERHHLDYLMIASMLDNASILQWGTSIRGAWFEWDRHSQISKGAIDWVCDIE